MYCAARSFRTLNHVRSLIEQRNCRIQLPWLALINQLENQKHFHVNLPLYKYVKTPRFDDIEDEIKIDSEFKDEHDSKIVKAKVNSLRADLLLKAGLGMARNKVEKVFYESKIRVNGQKLTKKSIQLYLDDEIDVVRGFSENNVAHLVISRVIILAADGLEDGLSVTLRRYKTLLIDNYKGSNAYRST